MLTSQRKQLILTRLAEEGQVLSRNLSEAFGVSEDTIRRDLRELAAEGLLPASTRWGFARFSRGCHLCGAAESAI